MAYEQKDNSGSLFKNDKRENDKHPHMNGSCVIDGVEYWISAWTKPTKDGAGRWQSLAFKKKEPRRPEPRQESRPHARGSRFDDQNDDVPF